MLESFANRLPATPVRADGGAKDLNGIIKTLSKVGINFLAIDFDKTLISEHTTGKWEGTVEDLAS